MLWATLWAWMIVVCGGCDALLGELPPQTCGGGSCSASGLDASTGDAEEARAEPLSCREALSGELVINEVLLRPGGIDLDGDGKSNGRDEAIEVWSRAEVAVQLPGARLFYADEERGELEVEGCVAPGAAAVVIGATTSSSLRPAAGASVWRLDRALKLTDSGGLLELRGGRGQLLAGADLPPADDGAPSSLVRAQEGDPASAFVLHRDQNDAGAAPHSLGSCRNGLLPPECVDRP